ncbi:MAG: SPOR domain-containing protein [Rhodobacteraceae bacterium]|nr:SPOR domain-containing protein [Paracoccaceae bacterium]
MRNNCSTVSGLALVLAASVMLAGCMEGSTGTDPRTQSSRAAGQVVERDVEAPNVFSGRDRGLWDGRPSLGGVWVAHPDVRDPERVIIRNTENGKETIGALFRRERMNPGPVFQVSADAAAAIEMLAGAPTALEVVALRTEEVMIGGAPEPAPEEAPTETAALEPDAAQAPATASEQAAARSAPERPPEETAIAVPQEAAEPRRGLLSRIFGRGTQEDAPEAGEQIETAALDDTPARPAPPPADGPPPMPRPLGAEAASADAPAPSASAIDRPFIQLGIFSVEDNAKRAEQMARDAGLSARISAGETQGNAFWRVTVGPARTTSERAQLLEQVKRLGFNDAYAVRR